MKMLPPEILEMIFALLPIADLFNVCRVCKNFNEIISRPTFLRYKKRYYKFRLKADCNEDVATELNNEVKAELDPYNLTEEEETAQHYIQVQSIASASTVHRLPRMVKFCLKKLSQEFESNSRQKRDASQRLNCLREHPKFEVSRSILMQNFSPDLVFVTTSGNDPELVDNRAVAFIICMIADDISQIRQLLKLALSPRARSVAFEVSDLFYFILTYFLFFERYHRAPKKLHYQLYYALFLLENEDTRRSSNSSLNLTAEQSRIVLQKIDVTDHRCVKIVAFAGTGKTTTLIQLCKKNPHLRFLLVVFNRVVKELSSKSFPANVEAKTAHSLAYSYMANRMGQAAWSRRMSNFELKAQQIVTSGLMKTRGQGAGNIYKRAAQIAQTIKNFCHSAELELELEHVPSLWPGSRGVMDGELEVISPQHRSDLFEDALNIWNRGIMKSGSSFKIDPSAYLKLFQLSDPDLRDYAPFDVILIDEAQDMNLPMLDICLKQKAPKFIVGDPHQQIYGFNGAVNGMEQVNELSKVKATYHLTQSFRFGFEIAYAATMAIDLLKGEEKQALIGNESVVDSITGSFPPGVDKTGRTVILSRTNLCLFQQLVQQVCLKEEKDVVGLDFQMGTYFDQLLDISYLYTGHRNSIESSYIKTFATFPDLVQRVLLTNDKDMSIKIKIVEKYGEKLPGYVSIIRSRAQSIDHPDVKLIFSTVHKFKGLECETVILTEDFGVDFLPTTKPRINDHNLEECNLLYVALTRAKRRLILNTTLFHLLHGSAMDNFQTLRVTSSIPFHKRVCVFCQNSFRNPAAGSSSVPILTVWQEEVSIFPERRIQSGPACPNCAQKPLRKILFVDQLQSGLAMNSWSAVMSGIIGMPSPFKNPLQFVTPVLKMPRNDDFDSDDDLEEMMLAMD